MRPGFQIEQLSFIRITEIGQPALLLHGLGPFHVPTASMSSVSSFCHSVSLILVLCLLQLCPNHPPLFDNQLGKAHFLMMCQS